ncbi:hypothetical protein ACTPEF_26710, partial [Clostridioides difficile]
HMGEVQIKGAESEKFIQNLVTNDISTLKINDIIYTPMCYENGLEKLMEQNKYNPFTLEESVNIVKKVLVLFYVNNINVIRVGL